VPPGAERRGAEPGGDDPDLLRSRAGPGRLRPSVVSSAARTPAIAQPIGLGARPLLDERQRSWLGRAGVAGLVVCGTVMAVAAAGGRTFDVPVTKIGTPGWIMGPVKGLAPTPAA